MFYKDDVVEVINIDDDQFITIGHRYKVLNVFDDFVVVDTKNKANNYLHYYEIILYKRPIKNKIINILRSTKCQKKM